jgi:hypothetical protein
MRTLAERQCVAPPTEHQAWKALEVHFQHLKKLHLRDLIADSPTHSVSASLSRLTTEGATRPADQGGAAPQTERYL